MDGGLFFWDPIRQYFTTNKFLDSQVNGGDYLWQLLFKSLAIKIPMECVSKYYSPWYFVGWLFKQRSGLVSYHLALIRFLIRGLNHALSTFDYSRAFIRHHGSGKIVSIHSIQRFSKQYPHVLGHTGMLFHPVFKLWHRRI